MKYINIVQRFIPLQFGEVYKESDLLEGFKGCLEKINTDGMMVLNDFSLFQAYFNDGIRSQRSNYNFIYIFIYLQFAVFVLYFVSASTNTVGNLVASSVVAGKKVNKDIKIGVCGEHAGDPKSIKFLNTLDIDYISCSPFRIPTARLAAAQAEIS